MVELPRLIAEGYARSSVFAVDKKFKSEQRIMPANTEPMPEDLWELRYQNQRLPGIM